MVNNYFSNDSLSFLITEKDFVSTAMKCLSLFCKALGAILSDHKTGYWVIVLDYPFSWIPIT